MYFCNLRFDMAVMTAQQRTDLLADIMRVISRDRTPCPFLKSVLSATIDAVDQWANDNAASFNTALPVAFRTTATADMKSHFFEAVVARRRQLGV